MAEIRNIFYLLLLVAQLIFIFSCNPEGQNISISKEPVFSEIDSFVTIKKNAQYNKDDYFIVKGNLSNREKLKNYIDKFIKNRVTLDEKKYDNYSISFFEGSSEINEKIINERPPQYRYKIFEDNKNEFQICSYSYWMSKLVLIDYNSKFK